jgi:CMP-N-acetylneuraminic acid synthetase
MLAGRPLLAYTADAARSSRTLTRVVISTEDQEIAGVAQHLGIDVPFLRPVALAADETPMLDVLTDLIASLDRRENYRPDVLVLLQPTSPFRRGSHIDAAVELLVSSGADSVVTVQPVPHQFTPSSLMELRGDRLISWSQGRADGGDDEEAGVVSGFSQMPTRRQDKPALFARNGPAVVAVHTRVVMDGHTLYGADTRGLVMPREASLDIDDAFDLELAERLMSPRT